MLKQLSIFAENIKGKMQKVTGILLEEDINILGSVTNDSAEYGIIRMVVSKPEQALEALTKAGFICKRYHVQNVRYSMHQHFLMQKMHIPLQYNTFRASVSKELH